MKKLHANATLTIPQRLEVKRLFEIEKASVSKLAKRFCVGESTIRKWINRDSPEDKSSAPHQKRQVVTDDYRQAVIEYRKAQPMHGARRIAFELKANYPMAHRGTAAIILKKTL
jgi:transposase